MTDWADERAGELWTWWWEGQPAELAQGGCIIERIAATLRTAEQRGAERMRGRAAVIADSEKVRADRLAAGATEIDRWNQKRQEDRMYESVRAAGHWQASENIQAAIRALPTVEPEET